jgi:hypothetical protein
MIIPHTTHLVKRQELLRGIFNVWFKLFLVVYGLPENGFCVMIKMAGRKREPSRKVKDPDRKRIVGGATWQ